MGNREELEQERLLRTQVTELKKELRHAQSSYKSGRVLRVTQLLEIAEGRLEVFITGLSARASGEPIVVNPKAEKIELMASLMKANDFAESLENRITKLENEMTRMVRSMNEACAALEVSCCDDIPKKAEEQRLELLDITAQLKSTTTDMHESERKASEWRRKAKHLSIVAKWFSENGLGTSIPAWCRLSWLNEVPQVSEEQMIEQETKPRDHWGNAG